MTEVNGVQPAGAPKPVEPAPEVHVTHRPVEVAQSADVVEISQVAKLAAQIQEIPDVRTELIQRVKAEIIAGTYETPERIEIAVQRLMEELSGG